MLNSFLGNKMNENHIASFNRKDGHFSENVFLEDGYTMRYENLMKVMTKHIDAKRIKGASVLDFACGAGGFGVRFEELGANVVFIDGRESNLDLVRQANKDAKTYLWNLEKDQNAPFAKADLALCMGLIYHTGDPVSVLGRIAKHSDDIFVETTVLDHDGKIIVFYSEDMEPKQFSVTGSACRPSPGWVSEALTQCGFVAVKEILDGAANLKPGVGFPGCLYDWKFERTCGWRRDECALKRLYIASKKPAQSIFPEFRNRAI